MTEEIYIYLAEKTRIFSVAIESQICFMNRFASILIIHLQNSDIPEFYYIYLFGTGD